MNAKKSLSTLITAILMLSMVLAITPIAKAAPSISLSPNEGEPGTLVTVSGSGFTAGYTGRAWFDVDGD
ncbi:MAG: IPT/TIG domain-containing protein, partial [Candidatus Bathyarchaeia archaeon]